MTCFLSESTYTDRWTLEAVEVFSDKEYTRANTTVPSVNSIFKDLNERIKSKVKSWWEAKSLENYIKNNIVPRGLCIDIQLAPRVRTPALMKRWERIVPFAS